MLFQEYNFYSAICLYIKYGEHKTRCYPGAGSCILTSSENKELIDQYTLVIDEVPLHDTKPLEYQTENKEMSVVCLVDHWVYHYPLDVMLVSPFINSMLQKK